MSRKTRFIAVILVLIAGCAIAAFGQQGPRGQGGILRQLISARVQARLNLTPDQVKQIREIVRDHRAQNAPVRPAALAVNAGQEHTALMKSIFTDNPNQEEIQKHEASIAERQAAAAQQNQQRLNQQVNTLLEINKVFTPAQRAEFQKMLDENVRTGQILRRRATMRPNARRPVTPAPQTPPPPPAEQ